MSECKNHTNDVSELNGAIEEVITHFTKIINNYETYRIVAATLNAIITCSKSTHLCSCDTKVLEQLKLNIHRFKVAVADYLDNVGSDIHKMITDINNANRPLEDMSKEELIAYIKSKENTSK